MRKKINRMGKKATEDNPDMRIVMEKIWFCLDKSNWLAEKLTENKSRMHEMLDYLDPCSDILKQMLKNSPEEKLYTKNLKQMYKNFNDDRFRMKQLLDDLFICSDQLNQMLNEIISKHIEISLKLIDIPSNRVD